MRPFRDFAAPRLRRNDIESRLQRRLPHFNEYYEQLRYEADVDGGFRLQPNQTLPHVTINAHGYRGRPFGGDERVLVIGDSVTFGVGSSGDDARLGPLLSRELRCSVADASMRAYRVGQHARRLPALLDSVPHVRVVVLWCGYVDLLFWATTARGIEGCFHFEQKYAVPRSTLRHVAARLVALVKRWRSAPPIPTHATRRGPIDELVDYVATQISAIDEACRARQADLEVVIQPFIRTRPHDAELRALLDFYDQRTRSKCGIAWYEVAPTFATKLNERLAAAKIDTVDAQTFVTENDFFDQVHLRDEAQSRIARALAPRLEGKLTV